MKWAAFLFFDRRRGVETTRRARKGGSQTGGLAPAEEAAWREQAGGLREEGDSPRSLKKENVCFPDSLFLCRVKGAFPKNAIQREKLILFSMI